MTIPPRAVNGTRIPTGWAGGWGITSDERSRVRRRTRKRERALGAEWDTTLPGVAVLVTKLAQIDVMAERTYDTLDSDPRSTRRIWAGLLRAATGIRAELTRMGARKHAVRPASGAALAELAARQGPNGGQG